MKRNIFFLITLASLFTGFAIPFKWVCNTPEAASKTFTAYHGETVEFKPSFVIDGKPVTNLTLSLYWQTNGMDNVWWSAPGATFLPSHDVGADSYRFFVRAEGDDGILYRANGRLRMLESPGFVPAEVELPARSLDFSCIAYTNAPWATEADLNERIISATNNIDITSALAGFATTNQYEALCKYIDGMDDVLAEKLDIPVKIDGPNDKKNKVYKLDVSFAAESYEAENAGKIFFEWLDEYSDLGDVLEDVMRYADKNDWLDNVTIKDRLNDYTTKTELVSELVAATNAIDVTEQLGPLKSKLETAEFKVDRLYVNSQGSNVWFSVTNFLSVIHIPTLRMYEIRDGKINIVWDELLMHEKTYTDAVNAAADMVASITNVMPSRAWSSYTSGTGASNPDKDATVVSTKKLVIAGNYEYKHIVSGTCGINVLCKIEGSEFGMSTNGTFEVLDGAGKTLFEIVTDKNLLPDVRINDISVDPSGIYGIHVHEFQGEAHLLKAPTLLCADDVRGPWYKQDNPLCPYNVSWVTNDAVYTATCTRKANPEKHGFFKFVCNDEDVGGGVSANLNAPLRCQGIVESSGNRIARPVFNTDGTVTWRWRD